MLNINKDTFYTYIRRAPFGGSLKSGQVDGLEKILDFVRTEHDIALDKLAYVLATVFHETAQTMQPIEEYGKGKGKKYGPTGYWGRGLVQITWEQNYKKFGIEKTPEKALEWPTALFILFDGMERGKFTGRRLDQYFNDTKSDPVGARAIVNGTDKAQLIAGYYKNFLDALKAAETKTPQPKDIIPEAKVPDDVPTGESNWFKSLMGLPVVGSIMGVFAGIDNPWAFATVAFLIVVGGLFAWLALTGRIQFNRVKDKDTGLGNRDSGNTGVSPVPSADSPSPGSEAGPGSDR